MERKCAILIVDDNVDLAGSLRDVLETEGYDVTVGHNGQDALAICRQKNFDLALIDIKLPDTSGTDLIDKLARISPNMEYIIITAHASLDSAIDAAKRGKVVSYEIKPLNIDRFLALIRQVFERKQAEGALRDSEERYRSTLDGMLEGFQIIAYDWRYLYVNDPIVRQSRRTKEELLGKTMMEIYPGIEETEMFACLRRCMEKRLPHRMENEFNFPDGTKGWFELSIQPIPNGILIISLDITESKQAKEELEESERFLKILFENVLDGILIVDYSGKIVNTSSAFAKMFELKSISDGVGRYVLEFVFPEFHDVIIKDIANVKAGRGGYLVSYKVRSALGKEFWIEALGTDIILQGEHVDLVVARDITERKKMEEQLLINDRLASLGELVSGVAHELNNPLTGVIGFSDLLAGRKDLPNDIKEDLQIINREAKRTSNIVKNLLTFARKQPKEKQATDINRVIEAILELREYEQKVSNLEVNTQFAPDLPEIIANAFDLQQVFLNIIVNAEHAMLEAHGKGTITITTERDGDIIRVSLADDGPGISKENLGHVFDPFFTTKEVGKGTGLGLSICYGTITEHGGRIYAESELGKGATFVVELPITTDKKGTVE